LFPMDYVGRIIRPPSEAESLLVQVTVGCSHNKCAFCGAYKDKRFAIKDPAVVARDLDEAAACEPDTRRVFLCDGDALILPQARLLGLLEAIRAKLPRVRRVAAYANAKAVRLKSDAELRDLAAAGLGRAYLGLESGSDAVLAAMGKGSDVAQQVEAVQRLKAAGIKVNVTVLLGLGGDGAGEDGWEAHARATGRALTAMDPDQAAALTLMLIPGTPLFAAAQAGSFRLPGPAGMLRELRLLLAETDLSRGLFLANHGSNYLPLALRLPRDKAAALARIDAALAGRVPLTPESRRRL
ncbi:MAG: radical SAM protein, partial [Desulfovibrionaceae bacterium]